MSNIQPTKTITYKTVDKLEIPLDLYLPENACNVPVLLWFHGGGLLQGRRDQLAAYMRQGVERYGYACISADYRLAPQVGVKAILEDVKDCIAFIRNGLATHVAEGAVDIKRLAVSGSSAGGYLALLAGLYVDPKPNVIMPIYPICDAIGSFFVNSQPPPRGRKPVLVEQVAHYLDASAETVSSCVPDIEKDSRMQMYTFMLQSANLAKLLGIPGEKEAAPFRISRCVHEHRLPPAYFLHGDADSAVGVEQADEVVGAMLGCGIDVQYERPHGKDHFLDTGAEYENDAMFSFMMKYI